MEKSEEYLKAKQDLIDDLKKIDEKIKIYIKDKIFTSSEIIKEIENESEFAIEQINAMIKNKKDREQISKNTIKFNI